MTRRVFVVHGFEGNPHGSRSDWLATQAHTCGMQADTLVMPNPGNPTVQSWQFTLDQHIDKPNENIFLVGHSLGYVTLLHFLCHQQPERIGGLVLAAGFADPLPPLPQLDPYIKGAASDFSVLGRIRVPKQCLVSDNGSHIPLALTLSMTKRLNSPVIHIPDGGHLMDSGGFTELPQVWEALKLILDADKAGQQFRIYPETSGRLKNRFSDGFDTSREI